MGFLYDFCQWVDTTAVSNAIKNSNWLFPVIESVHLIGLALLGGCVLAVDFRVFGLFWKRLSIARLARELSPWMYSGLVLTLVTGVFLFISEPTKCYDSPPFRLKMVSLILAILFTTTIRRKWLDAIAEQGPATWSVKTVCLVSLMLWSVVGMMGRAIGFY